METFTVWLRQPDIVIYIGGNPEKGEAPVVTGKLNSPQILVDRKKKTITIIETK